MKKIWPNGPSSDLYLLAGSLDHREASSNSHLHSELADGPGRIAHKHAARQACWPVSQPETDGVATEVAGMSTTEVFHVH